MYDVLNAYLENGLKIILHKIPAVKTISCGLWVKQGSSYETNENNGLSHLAEHLLLNPDNTKSKTYQRLMEEASASGVVYNAVTTKEYTCFHYTGLADSLKTCLLALACVAQENREYTNELFENEKKVVLQEATGFYSSFQQIKERTSQAIWGNTGTGKIIMGDMKVISNATQEQIMQILTEAYVPENSFLVVLGDIDYVKTLSMIEEIFSGWEDRKIEAQEYAVESTPGIYINQGGGASMVFSVGFRAPAYSAKNRPAVDMMVRILGQSGMQSRMIQEIRMKRGLSYTLGGFSTFLKNRGTAGFMAVCDKEKTLEVVKIMMDVLGEVKAKGFTEEEIEREKKVMETSMLLSVDNITDHLRYIGRCSVMERNFYVENEIRVIREIEKEELERVTREILQEDNMGLAAIGQCDTDKLLDAATLS